MSQNCHNYKFNCNDNDNDQISHTFRQDLKKNLKLKEKKEYFSQFQVLAHGQVKDKICLL